MSSRIILLFVVLWSPFASLKSADDYVIAKVRNGENVETLLQRFLLTPHTCNIEAFVKLNDLKSKDLIYVGRIYKMPLLIKPYNGVNIRSSIGISDYELAKKIEKLNLDLLNVGIRDQYFKTSKKIWVPTDEFNCETNSDFEIGVKDSEVDDDTVTSTKGTDGKYIPTGTELKRKGIKTINVPLMGPGYDIVHIEDFSLAGQVYYIICGHGGPDPGAMYINGDIQMCEDEYAYDVSLRLARNLMQHGATVEIIVQDLNDGIRDDKILPCDNDELTLGKYPIPLSQVKRLRDRVATINKLYYKYKKRGYKIQKAIEIHVDSRAKNKRQDVFFYYNKNNPASKVLAENIHQVFGEKYGEHQKDRGYDGHVEDRGIYMVRNVIPTMVFVELANIRNKYDQNRLLINTNRQALANWLLEGLRK
ncbi:MAG: N-acetylmuramoyl-L-alanine amidase [Saprospiraceae bacterium]|nr:N-acetylmuramoyl-L-alanine amidase [Saprospiraceae bacterium]